MTSKYDNWKTRAPEDEIPDTDTDPELEALVEDFEYEAMVEADEEARAKYRSDRGSTRGWSR
jgi:hypothetical protein